MNTPSNITAHHGAAASAQPKGQAGSQIPQGLLGYFDAMLQQVNASLQANGQLTAAQNASSTSDMNGLAEKIAAQLKKDGLTAADIQKMSPQDLAKKIAQLLQKDGVSQSGLQGLSAQLAAQLQKDGLSKAGLTSDLTAANAANLQSAQQTKDDIAKKIADLLEKLQKNPNGALSPAQLQQLRGEIAQLQNASGTVDPNTLGRLKTDLSQFLASQGVDQKTANGFLSDLTQMAENGKAGYKGIGTPADAAAKNLAAKAQAQTAGSDAATKTAADASAPAQNFTAKPNAASAKASGLHGATATALNALASAGSGGASADGNSGFNTQDGSAQQQGPTSLAALLQSGSGAAAGKSFTNYLSAATQTAPAPTTQMVAVQMIRNINAGINAMSFQLEPADLGRLSVKLTFAKDGTVKAHMSVDKPETLALLQKDASHLQNALKQSGLQTDDNALTFDLRQQNQQQNFNGYNGNGSGSKGMAANANSNTPAGALQAHIAIQSAGYITQSGVNIMV